MFAPAGAIVHLRRPRTWFTRHRWFTCPRTWQGWVLCLAVGAACLAEFVAIDRRSHSVSDTLYGFAPMGLVAWLVLQGLGALFSEDRR